MQDTNSFDAKVSKRNPLFLVYIAGFFFSAHVALTTYINSSFLVEHALSEKQVGLMFTISSLLALSVITLIPSIVEKIGKRTAFIGLSLVIIGSLIGMISPVPMIASLSLFVLYTGLINVIFLMFDLLIEEYAKKESMGTVRGFFLMINNIAWVVSPTITGYIIDQTQGFTSVYILGGILSSLAMITILCISKYSESKIHIIDKLTNIFSVFSHISFKEIWKNFFLSLSLFRKQKDLGALYLSHWLLRFFEVWMIIYMPLYLHQHIGFSWSSIGIIFTIMLLPFVLFQFPLGFMADKKNIGRKSIMVAFFVVGLATISTGYITESNIFLWSGILFLTRVGSSTIEVMTDTLFFKKINPSEIGFISIYRNARPLAFVIAPIIGSLLLAFGVSFSGIFIILGIILCGASYIAYTLPR